MSISTGPVVSEKSDLDDVREAAKGITSKYTREYWLDCARSGRFTDEMWQSMGDLGLLGLGIPEEYGGSGGGFSQVVALMEVLAQAGTPPLYLVITGLARVPIVKYGTDSQIRKYVTPTVTGEKKLCFAITEPEAGTNSFVMKTSARKIDGGWVLSGQKVFISGANEADLMLVVARTSPYEKGSRKSGLSLFVIDAKSSAIEKHRLNIAITAPETQWMVSFNDVELSDDALIGEADMGANYLFDALNPERMIVAAMSLGIGDYALKRTVEFINMRAPFGKPIGSYQGVQHPLARAKANLEGARHALYYAAAQFDAGLDSGPSANIAKYLASEAGVEATDAAIQFHGGNGFDTDYDIITLWPLARLLKVGPINNEMMLNYIGEHVLGLPKSY